MAAPDLSDRLRALLTAYPIVDGHNDLLWEARRQVGYDFDRLDLADRLTSTHTDLPRLRAGGVGAQFWSVWVPSSLAGDDAVSATLEQIDGGHQMVARYAAELAFARTADEVDAAIATGRIASLLGAEGGHSINSSLATLRMLDVLGVRYLTLTHNDNVPWADSATDDPVLGGLSSFGEEVVREMNRIGMLVDLSHVSADTMRDALRVSEAPVMFSHSSARAVCDHPRNVPDDVLETLRGNDGVCMVTFVPKFVSQPARDWLRDAEVDARSVGAWTGEVHDSAFDAFCAEREQRLTRPLATVADVIAHCQHVREVAGIEHIGLGGDYDGVGSQPEGLGDVSCYPVLVGALADHGWSDADLAKLTGANIRRVLRAAEEVAAGLQQARPPSLATITGLDGPRQR